MVLKETWVIQNNTKTILHMPQNKIRLEPNAGKVDLVSFTGKEVKDLEHDVEIQRELTYNNIITLDKVKLKKEDHAIANKLDQLITLFGSKEEAQQTVNMDMANLDLSAIEEIIKNRLQDIEVHVDGAVKDKRAEEDEKMREEAITKMVEKEDHKGTSFATLGKEREIETEEEDLTDFIDF